MKPLDASNLGYMLDNGVCSHGAQLIVLWLVELLGRDHSSLAADVIAGLKKQRKGSGALDMETMMLGFGAFMLATRGIEPRALQRGLIW